MSIWRIMAHHDDPDRMIKWSERVGRIAVGWGRIGDLRTFRDITYEEIHERIVSEYPNRPRQHKAGPSLLNFWRMNIGDLVIVSRGVRGRSHVVKITGEYRWMTRRQSFGDYQHQRTVVRTKHDPDDLWSRVELAKEQTLRWVFVRLKSKK